MSYWLKKNHYDVVIKGAGIAGVSLAYHLQQYNPKLKIAIFDHNFLGYGATGRNAGFLTCGSITYFGQLVDKHGINLALEIWNTYVQNHQLLKPFTKDTDYQMCGAVSWAVTDQEEDNLTRIYSLMKDNISVAPTKHSKFKMGILYQGDASVNPIKLLRNLAHEVSVDWLWGVDGLSGVTYDLVVHATNGFTHLPQIPITAQRAQVVLLDVKDRITNTLGYNAHNLVYFKQLPSNELLLGGARLVDPQTEQTSELGTNDKITQHLLTFAQDYLSVTSPIKTQWSGIMGFTPDHQPLVGKINDKELIVAGFSGHGMGIACQSSKILAEYFIKGTTIPHWMDVQRFIKGVK